MNYNKNMNEVDINNDILSFLYRVSLRHENYLKNYTRLKRLRNIDL